MIKIIADIGATNSRWMVWDGKTMKRLDRTGYNAVTHDRTIWHNILASLDIDPMQEIEAHLYGAGFTPLKIPQVEQDFRTVFTNTTSVTAAEDLLGSCHGMAQDKEAIIIILGTGSNSCHYDGEKIAKFFTSGGYILGDEGSASFIGKTLLQSLMYEKMPADLTALFNEKYNAPLIDIIGRIYEPQGGQYMGQFSKFASETIAHPWMREMVKQCLGAFFDILALYQKPHLPHYFTGSIAVNFKEILGELCTERHIADYQVIPDILDGMAQYHGLTNSSV